VLKIVGEAFKLLGKLFKKKPKIPENKKNQGKPDCKSGCSSKNPYKDRTKAQNEKSKKSYEELRDEHKQKLEDYKKDPTKHDNKGTLENAPNEEIKNKIFNGRIRELEKQIKKHEEELIKIKEALNE